MIVIQNDKANQKSGTVVVACITSKKQARRFPTHISIRLREGTLSLFSRVMLEQIRTIDKSRILKWIGQADDSTMRVLNHVLSYSLDLTVQENPERHDQI